MDEIVRYIDDAIEYFIVYNTNGLPSDKDITEIFQIFKHLNVESVAKNNTVFSVKGYFYDVREAWKTTSKTWSLNYDSGFIDEFMDR